MSNDLMGHSSEATVSGFQAINKFQGRFISAERVDNEDYGRTQVKVDFEEVVILGMEGDEPEPELEDDKFRCYYGYGKIGRVKAHKSSSFTKVFCESAEKLCKVRGVSGTEEQGAGWEDLLGSIVTMEMVVTMYKIGEENVESRKFAFAEDESVDAPSVIDKVMKLVVGFTPQAALKNVLTDARIKKLSEYRDAIKNGTLADLLPVVLFDGKYQAVQTGE